MNLIQKTFLRLLGLFLFMAFAFETQASDGHSATVWTYAFPFINFFILFAVLFYFLRDSIKNAFQSRSQNIVQGLAETKAHHDAVVQKYVEIQDKLKNADAETRALIESFKQSAQTEKQNLVAAAQEVSEQLKFATQNLIAQEIRRAQQVLRHDTAQLAVELAETSVRQLLTPEVKNRLQNDFVTQIREDSAMTGGQV